MGVSDVRLLLFMVPFLLLLLLSASIEVHGFGGGKERYFVGPGMGGGLTPHVQKPFYRGSDTAATYITANKTGGSVYNKGDINSHVQGLVHRAWQKERFNFNAGILAYKGSYTFEYLPDSANKMNYNGAGITAGIAKTIKRDNFMLEIGFQTMQVMEQGELQDFLDQTPVYDDIDIIKTWNKKRYSVYTFSAALEFNVFKSGIIGLEHGYGLAGNDFGFRYGVHAGYGPVTLHYNYYSQIMPSRPSKVLGVSIGLPEIFGSKNKPSP